MAITISSVPSPIAHQIHRRLTCRGEFWLVRVVCPCPTDAPQFMQTKRPPRERSALMEVDPQRGQLLMDIDRFLLKLLSLQDMSWTLLLYYFKSLIRRLTEWLVVGCLYYLILSFWLNRYRTWLFRFSALSPFFIWFSLLLGLVSMLQLQMLLKAPLVSYPRSMRPTQPWISQQKLMHCSWCWRI